MINEGLQSKLHWGSRRISDEFGGGCSYIYAHNASKIPETVIHRSCLSSLRWIRHLSNKEGSSSSREIQTKTNQEPIRIQSGHEHRTMTQTANACLPGTDEHPNRV